MADESRIGYVVVVDHEGSTHEVALRIDWRVTECWIERTISAPIDRSRRRSGVAAEPVWSDEQGQFAISGRLDGGEWSTVDPADRGYPDCYAAGATIMPGSRLEWFGGTVPSFCTASMKPTQDGNNSTMRT